LAVIHAARLGTKPSTTKAKPVSDEGIGVATATLRLAGAVFVLRIMVSLKCERAHYAGAQAVS